jgi:hypothetical protein
MFDRDPIENQYYQIRLRPGHMTHDRSSNWKLHPAEVKRGHCSCGDFVSSFDMTRINGLQQFGLQGNSGIGRGGHLRV